MVPKQWFFRAVEFLFVQFMSSMMKKCDVLNTSKSSCTPRHNFTFCNWLKVLSCVLRSVTYRKETESKKSWWWYSFPNVVCAISEHYSHHKLLYITNSRSTVGPTFLLPHW